MLEGGAGGAAKKTRKIAVMWDAQHIIEIAKTSAIRRYNWNDHGVAPLGYIAGMALYYADACERLRVGNRYVQAIAAPLMNDGGRDVLDWYAAILDQNGLSTDRPADRLLAVFAILLGLGMRENSGQHCEGRDRATNNTSAETAEAGLFLVNFNSISAHPLLRPLFAEYRGRDDLLFEFQSGVRCNAESHRNCGEGEGSHFQALTKNCPQFAALHAAILLRRTRKHWGPINQKKAGVTRDSVATLRRVQQAATAGAADAQRNGGDNQGRGRRNDATRIWEGKTTPCWYLEIRDRKFES